jgi:hypothetical protein
VVLTCVLMRYVTSEDPVVATDVVRNGVIV